MSTDVYRSVVTYASLFSTSGSVSSGSEYSAACATLKIPAAARPPTSSAAVYARHGQKAPPPVRPDVAMPNETAGFKEPPETLPIALPPTVTQAPMAKPKYSERGDLTVATERTTKHSTNVKTISATIAWTKLY